MPTYNDEKMRRLLRGGVSTDLARALSDTDPATAWLAAAVAGGSAFGLDRVSLDATYGDEFNGNALNARWLRHVQTSAEESYQQGGRGSALRVAYDTAAAARYIYQAAPNGTNERWECSLSVYQPVTTLQVFGLLMVDASGNGVVVSLYDNGPGLYLWNVANHLATTSIASLAYPVGEHRAGQRVWLRLRKATGLYAGSFSLDGENYSPEASGTPTAFTPARVGVGRVLGTQAGDTADLHWFDKT